MSPSGAPFESLSASRLATDERISGKASRLAYALRAGLRVPAGVLVAGDDWERIDRDRRMRAAAAIDARLGHGRYAVRSAFALEDTAERSMAGAFRTELGVRAGGGPGPAELVAAIDRVHGSGRHHAVWAGSGRRDVLVQELVEARHAGVAFTEPDFADDLVEFVEGLGDDLVSGRRRGVRAELPKPEAGGEPEFPAGLASEPRAALLRLRRLLREVRAAFGPGARGWDVEWADDGQRCWLLQLRPVTVSPGRDELFTVANHKEILPDPPSRLMASVMAERAADLYGWYRGFDAGLPAGRPFLELFHGRPRINLSLLVDTMRRFGLPSRLVTDSIGTGGGVPRVPLRPWTMLRRWRALARLGLAQASAARTARRTAVRLGAIEAPDDAGFAPLLEALGEAYVALVHAMFAATAAMSIPLALLRRLDVLHEHSRRHRSVTSAMFVELEELRQALAAADSEVREALQAGRMPSDSVWHERIAALIARHGHRGPFESDVASARFAERPEILLRSLGAATVGSRGRRDADAGQTGRRSVLDRLKLIITTPLWWAARGPLAAREELRDRAMRGFGALRHGLLREAARAVADGRLPDVDAVFDLSADELRQADGGRRFGADELLARRRELEAEARLLLPDVARRRTLADATCDDAAAEEEASGDGVLRGLGLGRGGAEGLVWVASGPDAVPPPEFADAPMVLVAPAVDAGWIPLMSRAAAVVVGIGGELSHGSIVLRELGVPAVTDVGSATRRLAAGQWVRVDAASGRVEVLPGAPAPRDRGTRPVPDASQPLRTSTAHRAFAVEKQRELGPGFHRCCRQSSDRAGSGGSLE